MVQVVDLEKSPQFQDLGVALVSIVAQPADDLDLAAQKWKTTTPLLSDDGGRVTKTYGIPLNMGNGLAGHTFVLVGQDGKVLWEKDYAARENGGVMYVPVPTLLQEITPRLPPK